MDELQQNTAEFAAAQDKGLKKGKKGGKKSFRRSGFEGLLWIAPAFVLMLIFSYYPPVDAFYHSLTNWNGTTASWIGLKNFTRLFQDTLFWRSCWTMVVLTLSCMLIGNICTIVLAELIYNCSNKRMSSFYRFMFVIPAIIPGIVTIMLWGKIILSGQSNGVLNTILGAFGIKPLGWFYSEDTVLWSIILYGFPWMGGTSFLIYLAGLNNIPESVVEASKLDGVGTFKRVLFIDLPMLKGQIKYFLIMGLIGGIQGYTLQYAITNGGPGDSYASMVPGYYMYKAAINDSEYGYSCAMGVVLFLMILIITILNNKFIKTEED